MSNVNVNSGAIALGHPALLQTETEHLDITNLDIPRSVPDVNSNFLNPFWMRALKGKVVSDNHRTTVDTGITLVLVER